MRESKTQNHQSLHLYYRADEPEILTKNLEKRIILNHAYIFQVHFHHDTHLKAFSQPISLACCQLSTDWERTFYICFRCRSWQQILGKWSQQWVFIVIRGSELKFTVIWVGLALSKISNQFSVHSVWHSDWCGQYI